MRPATGSDQPEPTPPQPQRAPAPAYSGPPRTTPPPAGWRPPVVVRPAPPRAMPAQDHEALDRGEHNAQTITNGVGLVAAAIMVVLLLVLCGRTLF